MRKTPSIFSVNTLYVLEDCLASLCWDLSLFSRLENTPVLTIHIFSTYLSCLNALKLTTGPQSGM